jgi:hypothetical protein
MARAAARTVKLARLALWSSFWISVFAGASHAVTKSSNANGTVSISIATSGGDYVSVNTTDSPTSASARDI